MVIAPHILIPSAAIAVVLMILFIRLLAGPRNRTLTDHSVRDFLSNEETGIAVLNIAVSRDHKFAFAKMADDSPLRLIRAFGDKLVMQSITAEDLSECDGGVRIGRQDIGHPGADFIWDTADSPAVWKSLLFATDKPEVQA